VLGGLLQQFLVLILAVVGIAGLWGLALVLMRIDAEYDGPAPAPAPARDGPAVAPRTPVPAVLPRPEPQAPAVPSPSRVA
jgi:hypothetical protein